MRRPADASWPGRLSAVGDEAAGAHLLRQVVELLADPEVAPHVRGREADVALAVSALLGTALGRYLLGQPALVALGFDDLVARVAPAAQVHLDRLAGGLPRSAAGPRPAD